MQYTGCESLQTTCRKEGAGSGSIEHEEECPDDAEEGRRETLVSEVFELGGMASGLCLKGWYFSLRDLEW